jgi:acyl carrier protein
MSEAIAEKIIAYLENTYLVEFGKDGLEVSTDLFEAGVFDSMAMANFTLFLEKTFGVEIDPDAVMEGAFVSVQNAVAYVAARSSRSG